MLINADTNLSFGHHIKLYLLTSSVMLMYVYKQRNTVSKTVHHVFLFCFTTLLIHNSLALFHYRLKICFTNLNPVVSLLPPRLLSQAFVRTVSSELIGFCF